jgi:GNAT superfamily N-acetyltransferase
MKIRLAEIDDNRDLCRIDGLCTQGKDLVYHYERKDFFLRSRLYDKWAVYLAEVDGVAAGSISVSLKCVRLNGGLVKVGYIFDLRVHPDYRHTWAAIALVQAAKKYLYQEKAEYAYTYVLGSNIAAIKIAHMMGMFIVTPFRVFLLPAFNSSVEILRVSGEENLKNTMVKSEEYQSRYALSEQRSFTQKYFDLYQDNPFRGVFTLPYRSDVQGCLWDSSVLSTKVVDRIPLIYRAAASMPQPVRRLFGIPALPQKGQPLRVHHVFDVVWDEKDRAGVHKLIAGLRSQARREGGQIVMCHLDVRDPLCPVVKKQAFYSIDGVLLMRTPAKGEKPPPMSLAYFDVRDF